MLFAILLLFPSILNGQTFKQTKYGTTPENIINYSDVDLWLPDTIYITNGTTITLYNDNVAYINVQKKGRLHYDWTCAIGYQTDSCYVLTSVVDGNYTIKCYAKTPLNTIVDSCSSVIKIEPKIAIGNKNILAIGNSLTAQGWIYMNPVIDDTLNITLTSLGTKGSNPNKHEGIAGYTYALFLSSSSPFWIGGSFHIDTYITTLLSGVQPDIIRISLGINECAGLIPVATTINNTTTFIDYILSQTTAKIIIEMPTTCENTSAGWLANYGSTTNYEPYILLIRELNKQIWNKFKFGQYNARVDVGYGTLTIDRDNGYPKTLGVHNNGVHPNQTGYQELIKGTLNTINHIYQ